MKRLAGALVVLILIGGAIWIGLAVGLESEPGSSQIEAGEPGFGARRGAQATEPRCGEDIPFDPTYLPEGFGHEVFEGRFPGGRPLDDPRSTGGKRHQEQVVVHYRGSGGRAIEIRRPGTVFTELAQRDDAPTIEVLGTETTGFAPISPGGDEFIVSFRYPGAAKPHQWCSLYSLNEYGVALAELKQVAVSLRIRASDEPFTLWIHCGLSYPLRFDGRDWLPVDRWLRRTHNPPAGFGTDDNHDLGAIRRIDDDTIIYTSSEGVEVEYGPTARQAEGCE